MKPVGGADAPSAYRPARGHQVVQILPEHSLQPSGIGMALGRRSASVYHAPHGPTGVPLRAAEFERWAAQRPGLLRCCCRQSLAMAVQRAKTLRGGPWEEPERPMNEAVVVRRTKWVWWVAVALLGVAVVIDFNDGNPLKLGTSVLLFAGSLLSAVLPLPRSPRVSMAIFACFAGGVALVVLRAVSGSL